MLFSEYYGNYYACVAEILAEAVEGTLTKGRISEIAAKLEAVTGFGKIAVDSADYEDVAVFVTALCRAIAAGKNYLFRCAAALPKVLGGVSDRPLLQRERDLRSGERL